MRIYLDDDMASRRLKRELIQAGHDVQSPTDVEISGVADSVHLAHAIRENRVILTGNYVDFKDLYDLLNQARGHHPGILVVRRDDDPRRDLTPRGIVRAVEKLEVTHIELEDRFHILNHWR